MDPPVDGWGNRNYYVVKQPPKPARVVKTNVTPKKNYEKKDPLEKYHIPELMIADLPFSGILFVLRYGKFVGRRRILNT